MVIVVVSRAAVGALEGFEATKTDRDIPVAEFVRLIPALFVGFPESG